MEDDFDNPAIELREIKVKNPNNQSLLYIVNFIRNKPSDLFTFLDCNNKNMFLLLQKQNFYENREGFVFACFIVPFSQPKLTLCSDSEMERLRN